ncbi:MAG: conjugal transfer pilus assembly protein TraU [Gammaproteobacteria bacterium]|nr:conjugal transfer pilus assembly protein TraU [Gammaproteobacteria bacterium]
MFKYLILIMAMLLGWSGRTLANCQGKILNPITDICWSCIFPISIGGLSTFSKEQIDNGSSQSGNPFCTCSNKIPPTLGIKVGFWEPSRIVEVVRQPYCFPSLGGLELPVGISAPAHGRAWKPGHTRSSFYQVHWYLNPILFWLEVLLDNSCLEQNGFDLAYFTEVDPLWADSELSFILNPEAALFTDLATQSACTADCLLASSGFGSNELFWCAGCQGNMYPLNGWVGTHIGGVQASALLTQRMTGKLHREGLMTASAGTKGLCGNYTQPIMDKRNYKLQMIYPVPATEKMSGQCCHTFGSSTVPWQSGKEFPYKGEDFSYQIFKKRDCCQGVFP